jgi:hypothetical protein
MGYFSHSHSEIRFLKSIDQQSLVVCFFHLRYGDPWLQEFKFLATSSLPPRASSGRRSDETQGRLKGNSAGDPRVGQTIN